MIDVAGGVVYGMNFQQTTWTILPEWFVAFTAVQTKVHVMNYVNW